MAENEKRRLIDANDLLKRFCDLADRYNPVGGLFHLDAITDEIMDAPTVDAVEVVRCKDCKNNKEGVRLNGVLLPHWCSKFGNLTKPDDFCSYGERREGE